MAVMECSLELLLSRVVAAEPVKKKTTSTNQGLSTVRRGQCHISCPGIPPLLRN